MKLVLLALVVLLAVPPVSAQLTPRVMTGTPSSATINPAAIRLQQDIAQITRLRHTGRETMTVSGASGSATPDLLVAPSGAWVYKAEIGERADRPCHIKLYYAAIENGEIASGDVQWSPCDQNRRSLKITEGSAYIPRATASGAAFVGALDGLAVCTRNSNDRLKGIRLERGKLVDFSGSSVEAVAGSPSPGEAVQRRCNDWDTAVACPAGKVLVGVEMQRDTWTRRGYTEEYLVGLSPVCAGLRISR